jgi:hypothetical protein
MSLLPSSNLLVEHLHIILVVMANLKLVFEPFQFEKEAMSDVGGNGQLPLLCALATAVKP